MGTIFALRSRYLTLKNHISGYEKVLDFWKTDLLYWGHTVTFRPQLKKIWDYDFFAWYLHLRKPSDNLSTKVPGSNPAWSKIFFENCFASLNQGQGSIFNFRRCAQSISRMILPLKIQRFCHTTVFLKSTVFF